MTKTSRSRGRRLGALVAALALTTALSAGCAVGEDDERDGGSGSSQDEEQDD